MQNSDPNRELVDLVQRLINSGSKHIILPGHLVVNANDAVLEEIRRLCQLNKITVEVRM